MSGQSKLKITALLFLPSFYGFFGAGFLATFSQQIPLFYFSQSAANLFGWSYIHIATAHGTLRHQLCVLVSYSGFCPMLTRQYN